MNQCPGPPVVSFRNEDILKMTQKTHCPRSGGKQFVFEIAVQFCRENVSCFLECTIFNYKIKTNFMVV